MSPAVLALGALLLSFSSQARLLMGQKEALLLAFPRPSRVEKRTAYLTEAQQERAERAAGSRIESRVWTYYIGFSSRGISGYAYFETHQVRTLDETFMAALDAEGRVRFVELLAFAEPDDYRPSPRWRGQFAGKDLKDQLYVGRALRNMGGATLSAAALSSGVRRILAVHSIIHELPDTSR